MSENNVKKKKLSKCAKWFRFMRRFYYCIMWLAYPMKKYGHTEVYRDREYILVGNHLSVLDVIPLAVTTDRAVHYMAKKSLFEKGIGKWFTKKCECIPVNRDGNDVRAVMLAIKYLKEGDCIGIFPEGTRNKTDEMFLPFRSGAAAISIKTKTPIVPIVQVKKMKAFHRVNVLIGEPFEFTDYYDKKLEPQDIEACDEILKNKFTEMYRELNDILNNKKKKSKKQ